MKELINEDVKDVFVASPNYRNFILQLKSKNMDERSIAIDMEMIRADNVQEYMSKKSDYISTEGVYSPFSTFKLIVTTVLFIIFLVGNMTGLESMSRYKYFEESLPISKKDKYLTKAVFTILSSSLFFALQIAIMLIVQKISPYSDVMNYSSFIFDSILFLLFQCFSNQIQTEILNI